MRSNCFVLLTFRLPCGLKRYIRCGRWRRKYPFLRDRRSQLVTYFTAQKAAQESKALKASQLMSDYAAKKPPSSGTPRQSLFSRQQQAQRQLQPQLLSQKYDYFFDIGAYIGYYSLSLCKLVNNTAAFEPNLQNFQRLSKNVEINNFNISCHNLGCSDSKNKLKLWYTDKNKRGGSSILQDTDKEINKYDKTKLLFEEIDTDKLDNLYPLKNKKIFFKIDVERHELSVLKGASNILSNNHCYLQIEIFALCE